MIQFQENTGWKDGQNDGRMDKTLFHSTLLATARGPKRDANV